MTLIGKFQPVNLILAHILFLNNKDLNAEVAKLRGFEAPDSPTSVRVVYPAMRGSVVCEANYSNSAHLYYYFSTGGISVNVSESPKGRDIRFSLQSSNSIVFTSKR
jgi:hypothetical protein